MFGSVLLETMKQAAAACRDVTAMGRFSPAVDPVRWVEQLQEFLEGALRNAGASTAEDPDHLKFRREVLDLAMTMDGGDFAGDVNPGDMDTVEGVARAHAIIAAASDFDVGEDGYLYGLVSGDQGWANTGIVVKVEENGR